MPLVDAKCTNCAGVLKVDDSKEAAICPYCGSAYIVEKAINNFNITNNINVKDSIVNVYVEQSFDAEGYLIKAKQAMKFAQYIEAEELFRKVLDNDPRNEIASTGLMLCAMMDGLLFWEKQVFLRIPDFKDQPFLNGNQKEYNEICVEFKDDLMRAVSFNPDKLYLVMDYLAVRGCAYEERYRETRKYSYFACMNMYFYLFSQNYADNEYSKLLMDRIKYYNDYDEYSKSEVVYSWDSLLTWEEYVSYEELKENDLMGKGKFLFEAINKEEFEKAAIEYTLSKDYKLGGR